MPGDGWGPTCLRHVFLADHPFAAKLVGPPVGPLVVLWKGGISFGGMIALICTDLPILNIYRKYHGARMAGFLLVTFFTAMAVAGYIVEFAFGGLGLIPDDGITWNYTTWPNIAFLLPAASPVGRFLRSSGPAMLRMTGGSPDHTEHEDHGSRMHNGHHH